MKLLLIYTLWALLVGGLFSLLLIRAVDMPTVYTSYSTNKCVRVSGPQYTCSDLPPRYHNVWVE